MFQVGDLLYQIDGKVVFKRPMDPELLTSFKGIAGSSTEIGVIRRTTGKIVTATVTRPGNGPNKRGSFGERNKTGGSVSAGYTCVGSSDHYYPSSSPDRSLIRTMHPTVKPISPTPPTKADSATDDVSRLLESPRCGNETDQTRVVYEILGD